MGVRDHVPCEYFQNNGVTGILMYILKTFDLIHFHFWKILLYVTSFSMYFCILCSDFIYIKYLYSALFINYHALMRIHTTKYNI